MQGWYIVTYALGIYHLNLFIAFLTPKIDPALDLDGEYIYISKNYLNMLRRLYLELFYLWGRLKCFNLLNLSFNNIISKILKIVNLVVISLNYLD